MSETPKKTAADLVSEICKAVTDKTMIYDNTLEAIPAFADLMALKGDARSTAIVLIFEGLGAESDKIRAKSTATAGDWWNLHWVNGFSTLATLARFLLRSRVDLTTAEWGSVLTNVSKYPSISISLAHTYLAFLVPQLEKATAQNPSIAEHSAADIRRIADAMIVNSAEARIARRLLGLIAAPCFLPIARGEAWTDRATDDVQAMRADRAAWVSLLEHAMDATGSSPSLRWQKGAQERLATVGRESFASLVMTWFTLVEKPRTSPLDQRGWSDNEYTILDPHMDLLKGLCWMAGSIQDPEMARSLARLALTSYRKVPGAGPRAIRVGNAAVYALGQMPGRDALGQLAFLRVKVKFGTAQQSIEKALNASAEREGLPREEIDELAVPSYGLSGLGVRVESMGQFEAELAIAGIGPTELRFFKLDAEGRRGKPIKSAPAALKASHAEDLKELKAAAKDIAAMLPAQRDRIDSLFLENKTWSYGVWRERYLDHPLVGVLARRLIWRISDGRGETWRSVTWQDSSGTLTDLNGKSASVDADSAMVRLWHPIDVTTTEVLAWRRFFEGGQVRQPFKQAHREVYLLTDAERRTGTYSNRFAAHIIRQHQFHALCAVRGWKNKLRLMVDAEYPPASRVLTAWNLRAEFWIEGAGDEYGVHTNEAGSFLHLVTDQVRFYPVNAGQMTAHAGGGGYGHHDPREGLPLDTVPALVFSEIMRDVDLFVGVGSVGNNPQWQDGGPGGTHREYWHSFSFGDLSETGIGRKDLLARLLPRLKIAPLCDLRDRFLVVKGKIRTYKIHLGSGNILMEPNDQYLCIVPGSKSKSLETPFLPFEGDRTLSIILSKALMLAEDDKIKDPSITRQISAS